MYDFDPEEPAFRERFDRWFRRAYVHTSRRIRDRREVEHIVETALERNVDLLRHPTEERESAARLLGDLESLAARVHRAPTTLTDDPRLPR